MTLQEFDVWFDQRYHRTTSALTSSIFILADLVGVMLSFGTGFFLVNAWDVHAINFKSFVTYWPYLPAFIILFYAFHLYPGVTMAPAEELRRFFVASLLGHAGIILSISMQSHRVMSLSIAFSISCLVSVFILLTCRSALRSRLSQTRWWGIPAVIYGIGVTGQDLVNRLIDNRRIGYIPVCILDDSTSLDAYRGVPIIHDSSLGPELVRRHHIRMAVVAMPGVPRERLVEIFVRSVSAFRYNALVPDFFGMTNMSMNVRDFDGILALSTSQKLLMPWNLLIKRILDLVFVLVGGILISPLFILIAILVKVSSPGPAFYGHTRIGKNGKSFKAWKFRSMVLNADQVLSSLLASDPKLRAEWDASQKLRDDPRVTPIGKFLRKTSLDELPQLWNVIKGEMSLTGPRPIVQAEVQKYGQSFERIFSVPPGMSGLWQVSGRSDTDYSERVAFDTYYLQSWSVWLDLWILYRTVGVVFRGKGAY